MVQVLATASRRSSYSRGGTPWPGTASTRQNSSSGWPRSAAGSRHHSRLMTQCSRIAWTT